MAKSTLNSATTSRIFHFPAGAVIAHVKLPLKNNGAGELFLL